MISGRQYAIMFINRLRHVHITLMIGGNQHKIKLLIFDSVFMYTNKKNKRNPELYKFENEDEHDFF